MNAMQKALVKNGLAKEPNRKRKRKPREFRCKECGNVMRNIDNANVMVCTSCDNYVIFDGKK